MAFDLSDLNKAETSSAKEKGASILQREISFGPAFSLRQKAIFYQELALMLDSGLTLRDAIHLLADEQQNSKRAKILTEVSDLIRAGHAFHHALEQVNAFSQYEFITIRMGEESGQLSPIVQQLSDYFHARVNQNRTVLGALTYPIVILVTSIGAVSFMMLFMVPMFRDVFGRTGKELPAMTRMVISISDAFANYWLVGMAVLGLCVASYFYLRKSEAFRQMQSTVLLNLPIIGKHYRANLLMQWSSAMALMLKSGVLLVESLKLTELLITDATLQNSLKHIEKKLLYGYHLHQAMQDEQIFDGRLCLMIKVAEEAHALNTIFLQIGEQYRQELEHRSKMLGTLLEPLIILFLGGLVGFILLAMYLPIFQMGSGGM